MFSASVTIAKCVIITLKESMQLSYIGSRLLLAAGMTAAGALTLLLMSRLLGPLPLSVSQTVAHKDSMFTVTGESEVTTVPDVATTTVGVQISRTTVAQAQEEANRVISAISDEVRKLGIGTDDIKTVNYSIYPEYDWSRGRSVIGYNVNASLKVTVQDFSKLNQVIDAATRAGANEVGGVQFELSKQKEQELRKQAREEAIADAKESASELARLGGMRLGRIVNVSEYMPSSQPPIMFDRAMIAKEGMGGGVETPTQIEPGSATYTYQVTLSYETN